MAFHLAETREQARDEAVHGLHRWHNEYNVWTSSVGPAPSTSTTRGSCSTRRPAAGATAPVRRSSARPTTWSTRSARCRSVTGGFGVVLGFAHDWANREATMRSWELVARYVVPEVNGYVTQHAGVAAVPARQPRPS